MRLEELRNAIERSLPPDIVEAMRHGGMRLTLGSSEPAIPPSAFQPVVIDQKLSGPTLREMLPIDPEWDEDADMVSLKSERTGIDHSIFISTRGNARHSARIKVAIDPPHTFTPTSKTASVAIHDYSLTGEPMSRKLWEQAVAYIDLNRAVLLEYWDEKIDTVELIERLGPIPR